MLDYTVIPKHWKTITLGAVCKVRNGFAFKSKDFKNEGILLFRQTNLDGENVKLKNAVYLPEDYLEIYKDYKISKGDVLIGMSGSIGKICVYNLTNPALQNQRTGLLQFTKDVDRKYIRYYFEVLEQVFVKKSKGVAVLNISAKDIHESLFHLPPLHEQAAIVAKIEELFSDLESGKKQLLKAQEQLKVYRRSLLSAGTSGILTKTSDALIDSITIGEPIKKVNKNWRILKLTGVAKLESGHTPRKDKPEYWVNGDIYWLSLQDIRMLDGQLALDTKFKTNQLGIENSSARILPAGTVCFCRDISLGYVTILGKPMSTTQHFANWICGDQLNSKYLLYAFMASRDSLIRRGQGTTVKTIYMPELKEMRIQLPPMKEQIKIVEQLDKNLSRCNRIEETITQCLRQVETLRQSILKRAFEGRLK